MLFSEDLSKIAIDGQVLNLVSKDLVFKYYIIPIKIDQNGRLVLVTAKNENFKILPELTAKLNHRIELMQTSNENFEAGINHHYVLSEQFKMPIKFRLDDGDARTREGAKIDDGDDAIIVQIFNGILKDAIDESASDIHILPRVNFSKVLFRINGRLINYTDRYRIKAVTHPQIIRRIKILCKPELDVSNTIMMQDGAIEIAQNDEWLDCRVSTTPSSYGEKVVIRIHNTAKGIKSLDKLGFIPEDLETLYKLLEAPNGMFLCTGPTSSGKTTTLYGCLNTYNPDENIIMTIEDPVELKIEDYCQVQTRHSDDEKLKLTFAKALRTALRQDPDVMLVGEIRDAETALVAMEASQTGHILFSTLHTKNSISTVSRLMNMGIDKGTLLSEIVCIIAQRLVGTNCRHCNQKYQLTDKDKSLLLPEEIAYLNKGNLIKSIGCERCNNTGFTSRTVVAEFLIFDNELRDFLLETVKISEIFKFLKEKRNFKTLWEKGLMLVHNGITTLEELSNIINRND